MKKLLSSTVGLFVFSLICAPVKAEEKVVTYKPYVAADFLSEKENKQLSKSTRTLGSSVFTWVVAAHGNEGDYLGLHDLSLALRRYSQADLFFILWKDRMGVEPVVEYRWVYNRKRSLLFAQTKYEGSQWPAPRFDIKHNVTDKVIHETAKVESSTLHDVTKHGATRSKQ